MEVTGNHLVLQKKSFMQTYNVQLSSSRFCPQESWLPSGGSMFTRQSYCFLGSQRLTRLKCRVMCCQLLHSTSTVQLHKGDKDSYIDQPTSYLHVQSLRNFPIEKLCGEVVLVRVDSTLLLGPLGSSNLSLTRTLSTIKHLYKTRAKVLLVTSWDPGFQSADPVFKSTDSFADYVSSLLQIKVIPVNGAPGLTSFKQEQWVQDVILLFENLLNFRGEVSNCLDFSQKIASDWRQ